MIGALDQQRPQVDIASLGDAELRVVLRGLAVSRPQAEIQPTSRLHSKRSFAAYRRGFARCFAEVPRLAIPEEF
jgi:hypothetical protein